MEPDWDEEARLHARIAELEDKVERLEKECEKWRDIAYNCGYAGEGDQDG